jgi:hypothetical protein
VTLEDDWRITEKKCTHFGTYQNRPINQCLISHTCPHKLDFDRLRALLIKTTMTQNNAEHFELDRVKIVVVRGAYAVDLQTQRKTLMY